MAVAPTYPGVYIEEVPSGVHTITGVATSITAFVGFTQIGPVDQAVHIFSFADFERGFGPVTLDSLLSRAVNDFFQNGGTEAYVVRVAQGAKAASVDIKNSTTAGTTVLTIAAASEGVWGNNLRLEVDYDTLSPDSLFNLKVTELIERNGLLVAGRTEMFRNLSMDSAHPTYVETVVNGTSNLVSATRSAGLTFAGNGTSTGGVLAYPADFATPMQPGYRLAYTLNGQGPFEVTVQVPATPVNPVTLATTLAAIVADLNPLLTKTSPPGATISIVGGNQLQLQATIDSTHPAEQSSIHVVPASRDDASQQLKLGIRNGGTEIDAAAAFRPVANGTSGKGALPSGTGSLTVEVLRGSTSLKSGINVDVFGGTTGVAVPTSFDELVVAINNALTAAAAAEPFLAGARAFNVGGTVRLLGASADPNLSFKVTGTIATSLTWTAAAAPNVIMYAPGMGISAEAQIAGNPGNNGTPPGPALLSGTLATKTGLYALEDVDLFNILVMPDATEGSGLTGVLAEAIAYCVHRRAFMIIDAPATVTDFDAAQIWAGSASSSLRSRNSALYFPRVRAPDPLKNGIVGTFPAAGALAGLYARTDADRGVWKAPAGTTATIPTATDLSYNLTDAQNGTLNPLGINCLRNFPIFGRVSWGARTGNGADAMADEYKYIPVRRLALFLEESLYRGTQWVVFEPNDEPLWAQIRLNLGAFMHTLFAQGAFQGKTPRDAYFVKCDKETTTQADIDLGRVNILVGFAPLKPAEFVIIRIQQIVRDLQT